MSRTITRVGQAGALILLIAAGVTAATGVVRRASVPPRAPAIVRTAQGAQEQTVYLVGRSGERLFLSRQRLSVPAGIDSQKAAIEFLARPGGALPKGSRVRDLSLDERGVLHIDFSAALVKNFQGGSTREALALAALSATVAGFPGVRSFLVSVEGKPLSSLGGHVEWSEPLPASATLPEEFRPE